MDIAGASTLWNWLDQRRRRLRVAARHWLRAHPRVARMLKSGGCMGTRDGALARGVAVGLFIALTPIAGVQTPLTVAACIAVRGNFPIAFAVSWVSNPLTWPPLYVLFHILGEQVFAPLLRPLLLSGGASDTWWLEAAWVGSGSLLVATPAAILGYTLTLLIERRIAKKSARTETDKLDSAS